MGATNVLFMGDDSLDGAAAYLGGVMAHHGVDFSYLPSSRKADKSLLQQDFSLYIVSDYPSGNLGTDSQRIIAGKVSEGSSLLMIGGWESFHGLAGEYHDGPLAEILPVECKASDDRVNWPQGVVPWLEMDHPAVADLPWGEPPIFCGYNETRLKDGAEIVLSARQLIIRGMGVIMDETRYPLLAFARLGSGTTAALTTDLAPHWVGGWVDWGVKRVQAQAKGGGQVEIGHLYAQFIGQLVGFLTS